MTNGTFDPSLSRLQAALWSWSAVNSSVSEMYMTLAVWAQVIDSIGDDIDAVWLSRSLATAELEDVIGQYAYVYGLTQEQLPQNLAQLEQYIAAVIMEDGTVNSLVNELMALINPTSYQAGPTTMFPASGGLTFPDTTGGTLLAFPAGGGILLPSSFGGGSPGIVLWQFSTVPPSGLIFPAAGGGLLFPILPLVGINPNQVEANDGTTAGTVVGTGAGLLPLTFSVNPYITVIQEYPTFVVQVQSYLSFDRGAFARAVARFQPAHLLPGTVQELNTL